jgi:hypothetical protein
MPRPYRTQSVLEALLWPLRAACRGEACLAPAIESLEPRQLLANTPIISEFMADNHSGLADADGAFSDWIEIHNPTTATVDLAGWSLTDDSAKPAQWQFPSTSLASGGYLVVFASGKNRAVSGQPLHTNFQLDAAGEYLALVKPDGTAAYEFVPTYPPQLENVSYGQSAGGTVTNTHTSAGASVRILIPGANIGTTWTSTIYNDASWTGGSTGVGFETNTGKALPVEDEGSGNNSINPANDASGNFSASTNNFFQLGIEGTLGTTTDVDFFNIGALQTGDIISITAAGTGSARVTGTLSNPYVELYRQSGSQLVKSDDESGPGSDALIYRFSITADDTYYVKVRAAATQTGTYDLGLWLENTGQAPGITTSVRTDTEPNETIAAANNASASWRPAQYLSRTTGEIGTSDDFFKFQFTAGDLVTIIFDSTDATNRMDAIVHLQNSAGTDIARDDGTDTITGTDTDDAHIFSFIIPSTGTYFVRTRKGTGSAARAPYALNVYLSTTSPPPSPPAYTGLIATNTQTTMMGINATAYLRVPFQVEDPTILTSLKLRMKYEDGFVAYINGQKIAERNAPASPAYNSTATVERNKTAAVAFEEIDLSQYLNLLTVGSNMLAIQGLNFTAADPDFLIIPELVSTMAVAPGLQYFTTPTPGAVNQAGSLGFVEDTHFNLDRGFYDLPFDLAITTLTPGAQIRYTTDGTAPTATTGTIYDPNDPDPLKRTLRISKTTTLRAAAFKAGFLPSNVDTQTYIFVTDVITQSPTGTPPAGWPTGPINGQVIDYGMDPDIVTNPLYSGNTLKNALKSIPTFSLVMNLNDLFNPTTGIFVNADQDSMLWERAASLELINPDGTKGFQANAGVRIRGGYSRSDNNPKHAFRVFFREEYGDGKLNYPLFGPDGADSFDKFDLRTSQNYSWSFDPNDAGQFPQGRTTFVSDPFARETQLEMMGNATRGDFYHLYINGQYWGLFNTEERSEAAFAASYYGGTDTEYDVIKVEAGPYTINATDGDMGAWTRLYQAAIATASGPLSNVDYYKLQGRNPDGTMNPALENLLDVDNLIDYMLIIYYTGNFDAPLSSFLGNDDPNNWYGIRSRTRNEGFKFFVHDSEHTLLLGSVNAGDGLTVDRTGPFFQTYNLAGSVLSASGTTVTVTLTNHGRNTGDYVAISGATPSEFNGVYSITRVDANTFRYTVPTAPASSSSSTNITMKLVVGLSKSNPQTLFELLESNAEFRLRVADHIQKAFFFSGALTSASTRARFLKLTNPIAAAVIGESARWGDSKRTTPLTQANWQYNVNQLLTTYFPQRSGLVLNQLKTDALYPTTISPPAFSQRGGQITSGFSLSLAGAGGTIYYTTDGSDPRLIGGAVSSKAKTFSTPIPLTQSTLVRARTLNGSVWSAMDEAMFTYDMTALRISEIMYHPLEIPAGGPYATDDFEYIELQNTGNASLNLVGVQFTAGISFTFPDMPLAAGQRMVVAKNSAAFLSRYPGKTVAGQYSGGLDNAGEQVVLQGALGQLLEDITYKDGWYKHTDGEGFSLVAIDPKAADAVMSTAAGWRPSWAISGNPGDGDTGLNPGAILINEALTHTDQPLGDWIELYNTTNQRIDLSGWFLSDTDLDPQRYTIPNNTFIEANSYLVFTQANHFGLRFGLSELGEKILLSSCDSAGNLGGYRESETFGAADRDVPFGRYIKSNGAKDFVPMSLATPGQPNAYPLIGPAIINELMYGPPVDGTEFIELRNVTGAVLPLYDPLHPQNPWKFSAGVTFSFPPNATIPAYGYALVVPVDPTAFRAANNIDPAIPIYGPYAGVLDNAGEVVELSMPGAPEPDLTVPYIAVDKVNYSNLSPWPTEPDGTGATLARFDPARYGNDVVNWRSTPAGGTPGRENFDLTAPTSSIDQAPPGTISSITIRFSERVRNFGLEDLLLSTDGQTNLLTPSQTLTSPDGIVYTLGGLTLWEGSHTLSLRAAGSEIADMAGNLLAMDASMSFAITQSTLAGTSASDNFYLRRQGSQLQIFLASQPGPQPDYTLDLANLTNLTIDGGDGNDTLTLDLSGGDFIPANLLFKGGAHSDTVKVLQGINGSFSTSNILVVNGKNVGVQTIESVEIRNFPTFSFNGSAGMEDLTIDSPAAGQTRVRDPIGNGFAALSVFNANKLVVDTGDGNDRASISGLGATLDLRLGQGANTLNLTGNSYQLDQNLLLSGADLTLNLAGSASLIVGGNLSLSSLSLIGQSRLTLAAAGNRLLQAGMLWVDADAGATLDLNDNALLVQADSGTRQQVLDLLTDKTRKGWVNNAQRWQGPGITSTTAQANPLCGLAVVFNDRGNGSLIFPAGGSNAVVVKYVLNGDVNVDGAINLNDYTIIDWGYLNKLPGYANGDVNYDGAININDYFMIDSAYLGQSGTLAAPQFSTARVRPSQTRAAMKRPIKRKQRRGK